MARPARFLDPRRPLLDDLDDVVGGCRSVPAGWSGAQSRGLSQGSVDNANGWALSRDKQASAAKLEIAIDARGPVVLGDLVPPINGGNVAMRLEIRWHRGNVKRNQVQVSVKDGLPFDAIFPGEDRLSIEIEQKSSNVGGHIVELTMDLSRGGTVAREMLFRDDEDMPGTQRILVGHHVQVRCLEK